MKKTVLVAICLLMPGGCQPPPETPVVRDRARVSLTRGIGNEVLLDGIGPLVGFARGKDCTFIHCLEVVLDSVGMKLGYDDLMAVSGMAFRLQFRVGTWDVGCSDPLVGDNRLDDLFTSIGWKYDVRVVRRDEHAEATALDRAIRQSIDKEVPVLAANVIPPEDWGIITGYRRDRDYLCRSYNGGALGVDKPAIGWPTAVVILTQRLPTPVREKMRHDAVNRAIDLFERRISGDYAQGSRAFNEWCESLRSVRDPRYVHANFWTYICLIDARGAAARYLRSVARDFGSKEMHVFQAADYYEKEVRLLLEHRDAVPHKHEYSDRLPPQEYRNRQIDVLRAAQKLEEQAIASLKRAL